MALDYYIYTTDKNRQYRVLLDTEVGGASRFGFTKANNDSLDLLPRRMKMRAIRIATEIGGLTSKKLYRSVPIGVPTASIISDYGLQFSHNGVLWKVSKFTPEKR
jgi:hypothetical protein